MVANLLLVEGSSGIFNKGADLTVKERVTSQAWGVYTAWGWGQGAWRAFEAENTAWARRALRQERTWNIPERAVRLECTEGGVEGLRRGQIRWALEALLRTWTFIFYFILFLNFYLFIYLWLCWVFVSVRGLSLVVASGGHSSSRWAGLSLSRPLLLRSAGSVVMAHGPSCSAACGIFPDQGSNPCPLHWQADSQPLRHQGSPGPLS